MCLLQVKHDVKFAHVLEVFVQCLNKSVDKLQHAQLILRGRADRSSSKDAIACATITLTSSSCSTPTMKNNEAYLLYTTFMPRYSMKEHCISVRDRHLRIISASNAERSSMVIQS